MTDSDRSQVYVIIAALNEGEAIGRVVAQVRQAGWPHVVVVDDGSSDDTGAQAFSQGAHLLTHPLNRGQGAALQTGISWALQQGARVVVTFDADGQHRTEDLPKMVNPVLSGEVHACLGSRFLEHADAVPLGRRWLLRGAVLFSKVVSGVQLTDAHNGFRALSAELAGQLDITLDRMAHASELVDQIARTGLPYKEQSVRIQYTDYSRAKGQRAGAAFRIVFDYLLGRVLG